MLEITCTDWPEDENGYERYQCSPCGEGGKILTGDFSSESLLLTPSDWSKCKALCVSENENGCCGISVRGCYWKPGSEAIKGYYSGIAVTCKGGNHLRCLFTISVTDYITVI